MSDFTEEQFCYFLCKAAKSLGIGIIRRGPKFVFIDPVAGTPKMAAEGTDPEPKKALFNACTALSHYLSGTLNQRP